MKVKEYDPLAELKKGLHESGITIQNEFQGGGHYFSFQGSENDFRVALIRFMVRYKWKAQDPNWFPGDPAGIGEPAYFIMKIPNKNGDFASTCLDFKNRIMEWIL